MIPPNAEQGAQVNLSPWADKLYEIRDRALGRDDWDTADQLESLRQLVRATVAQQAETIRGLTEQLAEARGHNGANIGNGQHPVHPEYGTCDAFADGGMCSECLRIMEQSRAHADAVIVLMERAIASLDADDDDDQSWKFADVRDALMKYRRDQAQQQQQQAGQQQ